MRRAESDSMRITGVPRSENPSDWLTKWIPGEKYDRSMEFCKNRRNRVDIDSVRIKK